MEIRRPTEERIEISEFFDSSKETLYQYISQPHKLTLWLANTVRKTSTGFDIQIDLPMYKIRNSATIIDEEPPDKFEFVWNSEYVMDTSLVSFELSTESIGTRLDISEVGNFGGSRWSDPQSIHIEIWKEGLERLSEVIAD